MGTMKVNAQIDRVFKEHKKNIERAKVIAVNRAAKTAVAQTVMFVRQTYNIKSSDLKNQIKITKASGANSKVKLIVSHKAIALIKFNVRRKSKPVKATISKGKLDEFPSAFVATVGKGAHVGVFKRKGKDRTPIKELYGPSGMQLISSDEAEKFIEKIFWDRFEKELIAAMKYGK